MLQKYERCGALLHCQVRLESIETRPHLKLLPVTDDLSLPAFVFASGKGQKTPTSGSWSLAKLGRAELEGNCFLKKGVFSTLQVLKA